MPASLITAFTPIAENSEATPGLFNTRLQQLQDNIVSSYSLLAPVSSNTWQPESGRTVWSLASTYAIVRSIDSGGAAYDIRAFGAVADGTTDNAGAVYTAVLMANATANGRGGVVFVPSGSFGVASPVTLLSNVMLVGAPGATIIATAAFDEVNQTGVVNASNITNFGIVGLTVDGNRSTNTLAPSTGFEGNGIFVEASTDGVIERNQVTNAPGSGIHLVGATARVNVRGNYVVNNAGSGIQLHHRSGNSLVDNVIQGNTVVFPCLALAEGAGIWVSGAHRNAIIQNSVLSSGYYGIVLTVGDAGLGVTKNYIAGNHVESSRSSPLYLIGSTGTFADLCRWNQFVGNTYQSITSTYPMVMFDTGSLENEFVAESVFSGTDAGYNLPATADKNTFTNCVARGCAGYGFNVIGGDFNSFVNCIAEANALGGLQVGSNSSFNQWVGGRLSGTTVGDSRQSTAFNLTNSAFSTLLVGAFVGYNVNAPVQGGVDTVEAFLYGGNRLAPIRLLDGTASSPALAFGSEVSLGLYHSAASTLALSYGRLELPTTAPASADAAGRAGQISWAKGSGTTFFYLCHSTNSWVRVSMTPW